MKEMILNGHEDDYDVFLQSWEPSESLRHATLPQYLHDPLTRDRFFSDSIYSESVSRSEHTSGKKVMEDQEIVARGYDFFQRKHEKWAAEFRDYVLNKGVADKKLDAFVTGFSRLWIDGKARRQNSPEMLAIKASIRDLDLLCYPDSAGHFVKETINNCVQPLFTPQEMGAVFEANRGLIDALMPDYIDYLGDCGPTCLDELYVRRGVYMPSDDMQVRHELHYLSSFSLALGPVEQFAQTWTRKTRNIGSPAIFSAPMAAIQNRVVAFAPFIASMDLSQLELVIAPPVESTRLKNNGLHGKIREYSFE